MRLAWLPKYSPAPPDLSAPCTPPGSQHLRWLPAQRTPGPSPSQGWAAASGEPGQHGGHSRLPSSRVWPPWPCVDGAAVCWWEVGTLRPHWTKPRSCTYSEELGGPSRILLRRQLCRKTYWLWGRGRRLRGCGPAERLQAPSSQPGIREHLGAFPHCPHGRAGRGLPASPSAQRETEALKDASCRLPRLPSPQGPFPAPRPSPQGGDRACYGLTGVWIMRGRCSRSVYTVWNTSTVCSSSSCCSSLDRATKVPERPTPALQGQRAQACEGEAPPPAHCPLMAPVLTCSAPGWARCPGLPSPAPEPAP